MVSNAPAAQGERMCVLDGPRHGCFGAIAGTREERAELLACKREREGCSECVRGVGERELLDARVRDGDDEGDDTHYGKQRVVNHGEAEEPCGMATHDRPVENDKQKAGTGDGGEERENGEIPKLVRVQAHDARCAQEKPEGE